MATQPQTVILEDDPSGPLTATQLPNGEIVISHAPVNTIVTTTGGSSTTSSLLDGQIMGIDKKLIALGLLAWLVLKK